METTESSRCRVPDGVRLQHSVSGLSLLQQVGGKGELASRLLLLCTLASKHTWPRKSLYATVCPYSRPAARKLTFTCRQACARERHGLAVLVLSAIV